MPPKLPLPRGWKHRVQSISWNNGPFTAHLDQHTGHSHCIARSASWTFRASS